MRKVRKVANPTTVIELKGMRIVATNGVSAPETAKPTPVRLYIRENAKLILR